MMVKKVKQVGGHVALLLSAVVALFTTGLLFASGANAAAGDDPALDAITGLGTKVTLYGGAIVALVAISMAIWLGIRYMKSGTSKA